MKADLSQRALATAYTWKLPAGVQFGFVLISQDLVLWANPTGGLWVLAPRENPRKDLGPLLPGLRAEEPCLHQEARFGSSQLPSRPCGPSRLWSSHPVLLRGLRPHLRRLSITSCQLPSKACCESWLFCALLLCSEDAVGVVQLLPCPALGDPVDCSPPGSSVHGILQARRLEWVAMPSSRGIFPTQGSNLSVLHWQADSLSLSYQGSSWLVCSDNLTWLKDRSKAPVLWPPDGKSWLIGKDPGAGKDWGQEEKRATEEAIYDGDFGTRRVRSKFQGKTETANMLPELLGGAGN